jgi:hypothetical protein
MEALSKNINLEKSLGEVLSLPPPPAEDDDIAFHATFRKVFRSEAPSGVSRDTKVYDLTSFLTEEELLTASKYLRLPMRVKKHKEPR